MEIVRFEDSSWIGEDSQDCRVHMINFREVLIEIMLALKKKKQGRRGVQNLDSDSLQLLFLLK